MKVKRPEDGEIVFEDDVVVMTADTLMRWTDSIISIAELRAAVARREGKKWTSTKTS